jgi:LysM repeat protein/ABC-type branched-subunit amino acid transport system substrate-binding protein
LLVFFLFAPDFVYSQTPSGNDVVVEVSKEKILVNNKTYFLHKVKKGENLFRISRAYNVTQKDIIIANPETISGNIKEGQVLKIPAETSARTVPQIESDNFIYHITGEKQTIYYITQKYKISQDELFKYNPELQYSPLQVGQVVRIPKTPNAPLGTDKFKPIVKYEEYKVRRKETMYSIANDHNITVNELIEANPILNTEDLKKGQTIQIPVKSDTEIVSIPILNRPDTASQFTLVKDTTPCSAQKPFSGTVNVAILLPIFIEGNETVQLIDSMMMAKDGERMNYETNDVYLLTSNLLEFYQGALLAIDSLKKAGMSMKVYVFDTGKDNQKLTSILSKPEMCKMDLIIGPLTYNSESLEKTAQFALNNQIKMVSPVSPNIKIANNNPFVFQINTNESYCIDAILKYIASTYDKRNIILINSNKESDKDTFELFKNKLSAFFPNQFKVFDYSDDPKMLNQQFLKDVDNIVIFPSEHEPTVSSLLNYLRKLPQNISIKVIGSSSWTVFKSINQDILYGFEFQYATPFYIDLNASATRNFLNKYKFYYKTLPSFHTKDYSPQFVTKDGYNLAFLGYDATFYFLNSIELMGKNFQNCIGQQKIDLLQTNIIFERCNPQGGFVNKGINIIKYTKDYNVVKVH